MLTYADTSFLVPLYLSQPNVTAIAERVMAETPLPVVLSPLTLLEMRNSFNMALRRREISALERDSLWAVIQRQRREGFYREYHPDCELWHGRARKLSDRYTPEFGTRSLDLLHISAALLVRADFFLTFDERQKAVAVEEGFKLLTE